MNLNSHTIGSGITVVSLMRTDYNATDEWVTVFISREFSHMGVGYYTISANSDKISQET